MPDDTCIGPDLASSATWARRASELERTGCGLDSDGKAEEALASYRLRAPLAGGRGMSRVAQGRTALEDHAAELEARISYLGVLNGAPALVPCERHLECARLTLAESQGIAGTQALGFMTACGAVAGLLLSGPRLSVCLAAGLANLALLDNSPGLLARQAGRNGAEVLGRASERAGSKLRSLEFRRDFLHGPLILGLGEIVFAARTAV
eukprot:CAMPEP_0179224706 /NCGR_PEP_ID=MMETSP0797-20121207/7926_1 /TAXON_ID=47934 /ORGANISM="Dinophysis acuminata, Strain DAEP01" /LENGTH=207 /DNA_ID=CAMNT_0020931691 /DNA_START=59 /DNA_END=680 /DNA_ORIENTATION=+